MICHDNKSNGRKTFCLHHAGMLGGSGIALLVINLYSRWRWVASFTLPPPYPRDGPPQSRSGRFCETGNELPLPGIKHRTVQPVSNPITGLDKPRGFQEVETPRFQDSRYMVVRLSALRTGRLYSPGNIPGTHFC